MSRLARYSGKRLLVKIDCGLPQSCSIGYHPSLSTAYIFRPKPNCRRLLAQATLRACSLALPSDGSIMAISVDMVAITTSNSERENPPEMLPEYSVCHFVILISYIFLNNLVFDFAHKNLKIVLPNIRIQKPYYCINKKIDSFKKIFIG